MSRIKVLPMRDVGTLKRLTIGLGPANYAGEEDDGPFLRITAGQEMRGRYDVDTSNLVFWRGDTRGPSEVFDTGLSSRFVRDHQRREIVWRCGVDDVVHASAVCLARDIRGAAFFPFPDHAKPADTFWLYALYAPRAACTYDIQRLADMTETSNGKNHFSRLPDYDWRNPDRFVYDPTWENVGDACCVWQFAEYAVHEVPRTHVLAAWQCERSFAVACSNDERGVAGIRFKLKGPIIVGPGKSLLPVAYGEAVRIATPYLFDVYPKAAQRYLSYFGVVRIPDAPVRAVTDAQAEAVQPIVTASDADFNDRQEL